MSDFIDDDEAGDRKRALSNRQVLGFVARFWKRRPVLFSLGVGLTLVAISFDLALPYASGQLVQTLVEKPRGDPPPGRRWGCSSASTWPSRWCATSRTGSGFRWPRATWKR
jgi:hypothetical protein